MGLILALLLAIVIMCATLGAEWRLFWSWPYTYTLHASCITNLIIQINLEVYLLSLIYYALISRAMRYKWTVSQEQYESIAAKLRPLRGTEAAASLQMKDLIG